WGATKVNFQNRRALAQMLGMPVDAIDMLETDVGGSFGVRGEFYPEDFLIPFAARELQRPVKWIEDRREHMIAANHSREMECELVGVMTNKTPVGTYRAPGRYESNFFRERLLDMAASEFGFDPLELRRRNLIRPDEMPWPIGKLVPYEPPSEYDSGDYPALFD